MAIDPTGFPLDLTAKNPRNEVTGDTRTLSSNEDMIFVPDGGPFYTNTLIVRSGTRILKPVVDYVCLHLIKEATIASGYDVSAVIHILDNTISDVTLQYQVVGGSYANTVPVIRELLENADAIEKGVNWNTQVYAKPDVFPPAPHFVSGKEFSDWNDVTMALDNIHRGLAYKERASWNSVYSYIDSLIKRNIATIDLSVYYTKTAVNAMVAGFATKELVYTKNEVTTLFYNKSQVDSMIGDIDGNEFYYTEQEINAKFIERSVAEGKFSTIVDLSKVDAKKADKSEIYTRAISDDKYALKTSVYLKTYIDATLAPLGLSYTKTESDARYATTTAAYTKSQSDQRYAMVSQIPQSQDLSKYITRVEVDDRYLKVSVADLVYIRKTTADSLYAKIGDLAIITTLSNKFTNYYDKAAVDNEFATKALVANIYYTKVDANNFFASKQYALATFLRTVDFDSYKRDVAKDIATKITTADVVAGYVEKATLANNYYTQRFINDNFATLDWVRKYYLSILDFDTKQALKLDKTVFAAYQSTVTNDISTKASITYVDNLVYDRAYLNAQFVRKTELATTVNSVNADIAKAATYTWVDEGYYNRAHINKYYYSSADAEARFYSRAYIDSTLVKVSAMSGYLSPYAKTVDVTKVSTSVTTLKNNVYTKAESETRYLTKTVAATTYAPNTQLTARVQELNASIEQRVAKTDLSKYYYDKTQIDATYATKVFVAGLYYNKSTSDTLFLTKTVFDRRENDLILNINTRMPRTEVEANYIKTAYVTANYYTSKSIDSLFYNRTYINNTFTTKASFDALNSKVALKADVTRDMTAIVNTFTQYTKTADLIRLYMTRADIVRDFAENNWVTANFETKGTFNNYYTKAQSDAKYALKTDLVKEVDKLRGEINTLRNERQISVGDLYITTIAHASAAAVATALGYGTWARYGEGRALVGYSENGYMSGTVNNPTYNYEFNTQQMGGTFGVFKHQTTVAEMPVHKHSTPPFNKFVGLAKDVLTSYTGQLTQGDNVTVQGGDTDSSHDELAVADITAKMLSDATENAVGGSQPHPISQPSIVIGVWRRTR